MEKYNKLEFISDDAPKIRTNGNKRRMSKFECDCGNVKVYDYSAVKNGYTKQCRLCAAKSVSEKKTTHGLLKHPLYRKWQDMLNRCRNKKVDRYERYGGRGIKVCEEWSDFKVFYDWCLANGWELGLTIDRKEVNGNYTPSNCQLITMREQAFNKENSFFVTINDVKYSLAKLLYQNNMSKKYRTIWSGLKKGKPIEYYILKHNIEIYD